MQKSVPKDWLLPQHLLLLSISAVPFKAGNGTERLEILSRATKFLTQANNMSEKNLPSNVEPAKKVAGMRVPPHAERSHDEALVHLVKQQIAEEDAQSVSAKEDIAALVDKGKNTTHNDRINPVQYHPPAKSVHDHPPAGFAINQPRK